MLRTLIASTLAAFSLAAGFHTSVAAAPPAFIECHAPALAPIPLMIEIASQGHGTVRAAVHQCVFFWGGHPTGASR
jgi:hypothetical protein